MILQKKNIKQWLEYFRGVLGPKVQMYFPGARNLKVQKYFLGVGVLKVRKYFQEVEEVRVEYDHENTPHTRWLFLGLQMYIGDTSNGQYDLYL